MKNVKKTVCRVVGIVGLVFLCVAAYYGISMFQLQNNIQILNPMLLSTLGVLSSCAAIYAGKKA